MEYQINKEPAKKIYDSRDSVFSHLGACATNSILNSVSFKDSIFAVNELSAGLSVGIANSGFLKSYQDTVKTQTKAFNDSLVLGESFRLEVTKINNFMEATIAPMSGAVAEVGLATLNANKLYEMGIIKASTFESAQKISALCLGVVQEQQTIIASTFDKIQNAKMFESISNIMATAQIISSGVNTVVRSLPTYPTETKLSNLEIVYQSGKITEEELSGHQKTLDRLLLSIDPLLVEYRKGC
jgi:hypothetical protein